MRIKEFDLGYARGDYHDVYFGEIVEAYADKDYEAKILYRTVK